MPDTRSTNAVRLAFAPGSLVLSKVSAAAFTGDWLWVAGDEACGLGRPVRFEAALTASPSLPHGHGTNRAEALCDLPPALSGGLPTWLVLQDAPGADRSEGEHAVFGDLLRHE